jgi:CDP-paratose 2-epimerase
MAARTARMILITGGAGFVGTNLAERLLQTPAARVRVLDDLSRHGVHHNLEWLQALPDRNRLEFVQGDVCNASTVWHAAKDATEIYHLAAQVAVTSSVDDPQHDFEVNLLGTFNVLEAARRSGKNPFFLYTSTNKVYGALEGVPVICSGERYGAANVAFRGVAETEPLDFHSPYGCSKGAADQYVRDYARIYNLPTVVFRMSCIAGPRQLGTEDQGWVAHFLYSVLEGKPITIYGDGYQVRDVLHVQDLVNAMGMAYAAREHTAGEIYNMGGGPERTVSIVEMLRMISQETGLKPILQHGVVRPGDQPLYVSDTSKIERETGWKALFSCEQTLQAIHRFWQDNRSMLSQHRTAPKRDSANGGVGELVAEEVA